MYNVPQSNSALNWRLIRHPGADGAWNMAVDEAILESVAQKKSPPTLRLYAWDPPCLSLGYAQTCANIDISAIHLREWQLVRRPTGGRAILHTDEITYAIIAPQDHPLVAGGVLESYRRLSTALLNALLLLGLDAHADQTHPGAPAVSAVCFETPSNYEITSQGKKLIGSAQARRNGGVLQHGSLPLSGDLSRIIQVLSFLDESQRNEAATRLSAHATTLEHVIGAAVDWHTAAFAFEKAFFQTFDISFCFSELSDEELQRSKQLVAEKYGNNAWTLRM